MKIVITGASGYVGRQLFPLLKGQGHELLLIGRNTSKLTQCFPGESVGDYESLPHAARGYDLLVQLAALNNNVVGDAENFSDANVRFLDSIVDAARVAGISRLLNVSTYHGLENFVTTLQTVSKPEALTVARRAEGIAIINVFLPTVHGNEYAGKLSFLNRLPTILANGVFACLSALTPTVHIARLADFISNEVSAVEPTQEICLFDPKSKNIIYQFMRRLADLSFAVAVLGLFWWALLIIWVLVKLNSPGPGIFAQDRVGKFGRVFTCYKFRSMKQGTKHLGTHQIASSSVTTTGKFLRKWKLDELPQVWNILKGEISLIGPRPCLPSQLELIDERKQRGVLDVMPGISGLAQISQIDMSRPKLLALWDARYISHQSLLLDLKIMFATFVGRGRGDKTDRD